MPVKNSFVSLANQIEDLSYNSLRILASLSSVVSSTESQIDITTKDANGLPITSTVPSVGFLQSEIDRINTTIKIITSVDEKGAIIQPAKNEFKKIILAELNREPNTISQLNLINNFESKVNLFFESLLNPLLSVNIDLSGKIESDVRKILSRRYIILFEKDEFDTPTVLGQKAIDAWTNTFKGRNDVSISELETWLSNTPGVEKNKMGTTNNYDEQIFDLEFNSLQYEGFFTILQAITDTINRKQYYSIDTLDYYDVKTKAKSQLKIGDELIINTSFSTTRYSIVEINTNASDIRVRFEIVEGYDPIPVGIIGGMKFYSNIIKATSVDITIGFNEYSVNFVKAINTDNYLVARNWSSGVAFYTNDLSLNSTDNNGDNSKTMQQYYLEKVSDYGALIRDLVNRNIPVFYGVIPNAPVLTDVNFRVVQSNTFLTDTPSLEEGRRLNQLVNQLRSKIDEENKTLRQKQQELYSKQFKTPKDKLNVENQIKKITEQLGADTTLIKSTVDQILANNQNNQIIDPVYNLQGFWQMPLAVENGKTRPQEVISFIVQWKYSNKDGKESGNETFKVIEADGTQVNAVFSPWNQYITNIRKRVYDINTQSYGWATENLSNIDEPNINSVNLPLLPNERITLRVKSISEVGYPDTIIESDWSNELTVVFPDELLKGVNPQIQFQKNADLEDLRSRVISDLDGKGMTQHLVDGVTVQNKYFVHNADNVAVSDPTGKLITLTEKLKQIETAESTEKEQDITLSSPWSNIGGEWGNAKFYKNGGRCYLSGMVRVDRGSSFKNPNDRFPRVDIRTEGNNAINTNYSKIGFIPDGYKPSATVSFTVQTANITGLEYARAGRINILNDGTIVADSANTNFVCLDGISFRIVGV